jgi:hypothetical protein
MAGADPGGHPSDPRIDYRRANEALADPPSGYSNRSLRSRLSPHRSASSEAASPTTSSRFTTRSLTSWRACREPRRPLPDRTALPARTRVRYRIHGPILVTLAVRLYPPQQISRSKPWVVAKCWSNPSIHLRDNRGAEVDAAFAPDSGIARAFWRRWRGQFK